MTDKQPIHTNSFNKGMNKDSSDLFLGEGVWIHGRNIVNNSHDGQLGVVGNEPGNFKCIDLPYTLIGSIPVNDNKWVLFSTDDINSEIGLFTEATCSYSKIVNDPCLNFKRTNLITGTYRVDFTCGTKVYWDDGLNPSRVLEIDNIPYKCYSEKAVVTESDVYRYTITSPKVSQKIFKASVTQICTDNNCSNQGETRLTFNLPEAFPEDVTLELGVIWKLNNLGPSVYKAAGFEIFTPASGIGIETYYDNPSVPFSITIPAGVTQFTTSTIYQRGTNSSCNDCLLICHGCLFPITEMYFKTVNENLQVEVSTSQANLKVNTISKSFSEGEIIEVSYRDNNNDLIGPIRLAPGDTMSVCAKQYSVTVTNPIASVQEGNKCIEEKESGCINQICTDQLDCEALRIAPLVKPPCLSLTKGKSSGTLLNGSYQIAVAYAVNGIKVTDYLAISNVQPLFDHNNVSGSLELNISDADKYYDELEVVVLVIANNQTYAKRLGLYSTSQSVIYIDNIDPTLTNVGLDKIPLQTPIYEKSDSMYRLHDYLIRVGVYTKPDFNYQPLANKIKTKWVNVQYPDNYYRKGGNNVGYLRDEVYSFFIRWIYNTGDKSASYHIPGRSPFPTDLENASLNKDYFELQDQDSSNDILYKRWEIENTATVTSISTQKLKDGGTILAEGEMGYWESKEKYPDNRPDIYDSLCGKGIRHHKTPDNIVAPHFSDGYINILGIKFENIQQPVDITGTPISNIIGYEILRGSREGQKSVIAKGLLGNMREYSIPNSQQKGLYVNYPYNDLRPDIYHTSDKTIFEKGRVRDEQKAPLSDYKKNIFSFHSPETSFNKPFLSGSELKIYSEYTGKSNGYFEYPYKHPRLKMPTDFTKWASTVGGLVAGIGLAAAIYSGMAEIRREATDKLPFSFPFASKSNYRLMGAAVYNAVMFSATATIVGASILESLVDLTYAVIPAKQYALQYNSHGYYNNQLKVKEGNTRRKIINSTYVSDNIQAFSSTHSINNLYRSKCIALEIEDTISDPVTRDESRFTISQANTDIQTNIQRSISAYYTGIKVNLRSQYGQLESIRQVPINSCLLNGNSPVLFGGDTYINRFTEKNTMFFFNNWMYDVPDVTEFNYRLYANIPYPRYWLDSGRPGVFELPNDYRHLNRYGENTGLIKLHVKNGHFYLFNSGVKDFYVESEVNLAFRDWEDQPEKEHYDSTRNTNLSLLLRSDYLKLGNYYKYDYSLSVSKLYSNFISWGSTLPRDYDPLIASTCYAYYPKRIIYSLPQSRELKKDNWKQFLVNNYRNMTGSVVSIKPLNRTGALIMMDNQSPVQIVGADTMQTDSGTKVTVGDGGLFEQPLQNILNTEDSLAYGSCQSRYSVIGTPAGIAWACQLQGKIFLYGSGLSELSQQGMNWWFSKYMPSFLVKSFPDYPYKDNPVIGVGIQSVYDSTNKILYFSKKDYKPKYTDIKWINGNFVKQDSIIELNDPNYFEDVSWTVSYDLKSQMWISFHDWKPELVLPGKSHFMTSYNRGIWKHNERYDSYCNYYNKNYPFEVVHTLSAGQMIHTLKSAEYQLEVYKYINDGKDKIHILDENFDSAIVYNSEQISGQLDLEIKPKEDPLALINYPRQTLNSFIIPFSKEENKYRFNMFWDITKDRGEFTGKESTMFIQSSNGYTRQINPAYVDYNKKELEHKRFRHYSHNLEIRKNISGPYKFLYKISNFKFQPSSR
jgi:hypothetical protein